MQWCLLVQPEGVLSAHVYQGLVANGHSQGHMSVSGRGPWGGSGLCSLHSVLSPGGHRRGVPWVSMAPSAGIP